MLLMPSRHMVRNQMAGGEASVMLGKQAGAPPTPQDSSLFVKRDASPSGSIMRGLVMKKAP